MTHKILVIPDVHGRTFWKEPVRKYIESVDKVVFLGDYLDPYLDDEGIADSIFDNLLEIAELKRQNMEKVILLKGNHNQHYSSTVFRELAGGSRMDKLKWDKYHEFFNENKQLFRLAYLEEIKGIPYVFTHAGLTVYWINKINSNLWHLSDNKVSITDPDIIGRINQLDYNEQGQTLLSVIGRYRAWLGEKTGSVLWADIEEHHTPDALSIYGMNQVFQVFGHTRLDDQYDRIEYDNIVMIDSQRCFMIDDSIKEKIVTIKDYEIIIK